MVRLLVAAVIVSVLFEPSGPASDNAAAFYPESLSPGHSERLEKLSLHLAKLSAVADGRAAGLHVGRHAQDIKLYDPIKSVFDNIFKLIYDYLLRLNDPLPFPHFNLKFDSSLFRGKLSLTGLKVGHLREIKVQSYFIHVSNMCASFKVLFSRLSIQTNYDFLLDFNPLFPLHRKGKAMLELQNVHVDTDLCLKMLPLTVNTANMKVTIDKSTVNVEKLFLNPKLNKIINAAVTEALPPLVQELQQGITYYIMQYIDGLIADIIPFQNFP